MAKKKLYNFLLYNLTCDTLCGSYEFVLTNVVQLFNVIAIFSQFFGQVYGYMTTNSQSTSPTAKTKLRVKETQKLAPTSKLGVKQN
jgi:hypothetical protein